MDKSSKNQSQLLNSDILFQESIVPQGLIGLNERNTEKKEFIVLNSNKAFRKLAIIGNKPFEIALEVAFDFLEGFNTKPLHQFFLSEESKDANFIYSSGDVIHKLSLRKLNSKAIVFSLQDVTSLQNTRAELNEKKRQLKESQEIASLGYWVENHKTNQHIWSDQVFKILNVEAQTCTPSFANYLKFVYKDDREKVQKEFDDALLNKSGYEITHRLQLKNGTLKHVVLRTYANYDLHDSPVQSIGIIQDITTSEIIKQELVNSEAIFRSVFDYAPIAIVLVNEQFSPVFFNNHFSELVGYTYEDIYKRQLRDFTHPDDYKNNLVQYERLFKGEIDSFSLVKRYIRNNETELWAKVTVSLIKNTKGLEKMAIAMVQDISVEKEATEALVKSEYRYRTLIDNASDGIGLFDYEFKPIIYNDVLYKMLGYTLEEYLQFNHNKYELFHPDDVAYAHQALTELRNGSRARIENRMRNKDGSYSYFSINYIPVNHEGHPAILIFRRDITQRKLAEQQNEEYRLFLETLMDNLPVSLFAKTTPDFRYLYWNSTIERVTGIPAEDAIGKSDFELMQFKQLAEQYHKEDLQILKSGKKIESEHEFTNSVGEVKQFKTIKTLHQSNTGLPLILGLSMDITKLKEAEKQVEQSTQMLKEAQKIAKLGYWEYDVKKDLFFDNIENRQILGTENLPFFINYKQFIGLLHESDQERVKTAFNKCILNSTPGEGIIKVIHQNAFRHISIKYKPVDDENGKVIKLRGTCLDITRIRKSEIALRESESRLKQAEHIAKVGYWDYNFTSNKTKFSDEIIKILEGNINDSKFGLNEFFDSVHPEDRLNVTAQFQRSKNTNQPFNIEFKIITRNNNIKIIKAIGTFVKNQDGSTSRSIGTIQDITDIKKSQIDLQKSETQLKDIQKAAKIGFIEQFVNSQKGKFSKTLLNIIHFSSDEEILDIQEYNKLIHPHDRDTILKTIEKALLKKQSYNLQYRLQLANGAIIFVSEICSIDLNNPKAVITRIIQDVSDLKEQQITLEKVSDIHDHSLMGNWEFNMITNQLVLSNQLINFFRQNKFEGEITQAEFMQIIHPDDRHHVEKALADSVKSAEGITLNCRLKLVDNSVKYVQSLISFYKNSTGEDVIYGLIRDISDYRNTLNELSDRNEIFKSITENSVFGIVIIQNNKRVYANQKWTELMGLNLNELNSEISTNEIFDKETSYRITDLLSKWKEYNLSEYSNKIALQPLNAPMFVAEIYVKQIYYRGSEAVLIITVPSQESQDPIL